MARRKQVSLANQQGKKGAKEGKGRSRGKKMQPRLAVKRKIVEGLEHEKKKPKCN